jgi:hypothetical protein
MSKRLALLLIAILAASSLIMVEFAFAQSVPEFTVKFADYSYDIPASTYIDPYTGKTVNNPAQRIENNTLQISIKNQTIQSGEYLYYNIRMKGHFSQDWTNISNIQANPHSEYTVLTYALGGNNASSYFDSRLDEISSGGTVDFQVQAQVWHYVLSDTPNAQFGGGWLFVMESASGWSNTQTITIPESQTPTPSPAATLTPTPPNFGPTSSPSPEPALTQEQLEVIIIVAIAAAGIGAGLGLLVYFKKRKRAS